MKFTAKDLEGHIAEVHMAEIGRKLHRIIYGDEVGDRISDIMDKGFDPKGLIEALEDLSPHHLIHVHLRTRKIIELSQIILMVTATTIAKEYEGSIKDLLK